MKTGLGHSDIVISNKFKAALVNIFYRNIIDTSGSEQLFSAKKKKKKKKKKKAARHLLTTKQAVNRKRWWPVPQETVETKTKPKGNGK